MNKTFKTVISTAVLLIILAGTNVMAAYGNRETIMVASSQAWNARPAVSRTGNYSYGYAATYAVYPGSGNDNFEKIQVRMTSDSTAISDTYTISEKDTYYTKVYLKEGYLSKTSVVFEFRGNHPDYGAYADVEYLGN